MPAPTITQSKKSHRFLSSPLPTFSATGASGTIAWSAPSGSFSPAVTTNGQTTTYTPADPQLRSRSITVTATDQGDSTSRTTTIYIAATFPSEGEWTRVPRKLTDTMEATFAEDGSPDFTPRQLAVYVFDYGFPNREYPEYARARDFWLWHRTVFSFYIQDPHDNTLFHKVKFDGPLQEENQGADLLDFSATFKTDEGVDG